jgi:molybdenum cofactor cytidylyltransferase
VIAGLVLAAGDGTRWGPGSKQLAPLWGRPLLEHAVAAACAVPELERVVVVLGADARSIRERVTWRRAEVCACDDWELGQSASLRCGAAVLAGAERVIVTLGDQPLVGPEVISRFVSAPPRARAVYHGAPGHPVVLGASELAALDGLRGDRGARELLAGGARIECSDLGSGRDVDIPDDLEAIRREARAVL